MDEYRISMNECRIEHEYGIENTCVRMAKKYPSKRGVSVKMYM